MKLIEQYQEVIERKASEVSFMWKLSLVSMYLSIAVSSYICTILFYTFWHEVSGGHCLFWAEVSLVPRSADTKYNISVLPMSASTGKQPYDWSQDLLVVHQYYKNCKWLQFACMLSCFVGMTMLMMFMLCGRGGYANSLFEEPWRVVLPSLSISFAMTLIVIAAAYLFIHGYFHFTQNLYHLAKRVAQEHDNPFEYKRPCEVFGTFTKMYNIYHYDSCTIYWWIHTSSLVMTWSWILSFLILCVRILTTTDFSLLKVKIYEVPEDGPARDAVLASVRQGQASFALANPPRASVVQKEKIP